MAYVRKIHTVAETIWKVTFLLLPPLTSYDISFASPLTHHPRSFLDDLNENEPLSLVTSSTYASIFVTPPFFASFIVFLFFFFFSFSPWSFVFDIVRCLPERGWLIFAYFLAMPPILVLGEVMFLLTSWDGKFFFLFLVSIDWYLFS